MRIDLSVRSSHGTTTRKSVPLNRVERPLSQSLTGGSGSAATVRRQWEQSLAERRYRLADPPTRPAAAERQVRRQSGQPPEDLGNVRYRRPPTFAGQIRATATSLILPLTWLARTAGTGRCCPSQTLTKLPHEIAFSESR